MDSRCFGSKDVTRILDDGKQEFLCHGCGDWADFADGGDLDERFDGAEFLCSECWCDINDGIGEEG